MNLSQTEYAVKYLGINRAASMSGYENGKTEPEITTLCKIAKASNVTLDWLLTGEGPKHQGDTHPQKEQTLPAPGQEEVLLDIFRELPPTDKLEVICFAGERKRAEARPQRESKKGSAAQ